MGLYFLCIFMGVLGGAMLGMIRILFVILFVLYLGVDHG